MEALVGLMGYMALTSVAAERFTEMLKRIFLDKLISKYEWKSVVYQGMAAVFGFGLCFLNPPHFSFVPDNAWVTSILVGLGVSGGSGAWNEILGILKQLKDGNK